MTRLIYEIRNEIQEKEKVKKYKQMEAKQYITK